MEKMRGVDVKFVNPEVTKYSSFALMEILYKILQDFLGSIRILQDPVRSHGIPLWIL